MDKKTFLKLQQDLRPSVTWSNCLVDSAVQASLVGAVLFLIKEGSLLAYLASQLVLGCLLLRSLFLMHDCAHMSLTKNERLNSVFGHVFGAFCFLPYFQWRYLHLKHHTYTGIREMDPLLVVTSQKDRSVFIRSTRTVLNFLWKLGVPYAEMIRSLGYLLSPLIMLKHRTKDRRFLLASLFSLLFVVGFWTLARTLAPETITLMNVVPGVLIYMALNELVSIPQHLELPSAEKSFGRFALWEHTLITRSVRFPKVIERHVLLNFNLHAEHHVFPRLPWRQLPEAKRLLQAQIKDEYQEADWTWSVKKRKGTMGEILGLRDLSSKD